jgi:hypothetical protein
MTHHQIVLEGLAVAAILTGLLIVSVPAALIVGGILAFIAAYGVRSPGG